MKDMIISPTDEKGAEQMNVIEDLLNKEHDSDVYYLNNLIPFEDLSRLAKQRGFLSFHVNGRTIKSRQEFLNVISTVMEFPYFGNNWDALLDCLRDLSWFSTNGYILLFGDFQCFAKSDQKAFSLALARDSKRCDRVLENSDEKQPANVYPASRR